MITPSDLEQLDEIIELLDLELESCATDDLLGAAYDIDQFLDDYERGKATYLNLFTVCQNALDALESVL